MNSIPRIYNLVNKKWACVFSFSILEFTKHWDDDQRRTSVFEILGMECNMVSTRVDNTLKSNSKSQ